MRSSILTPAALTVAPTGKAAAAVLTAAAILDPDQEVVAAGNPDPARSSDAFGLASFTLDTRTNEIADFELIVAGIIPNELFDIGANGPVHIHAGAAGENGGIIVPFADRQAITTLPLDDGGFRLDVEPFTVAASVAQTIATGNAYVNVHTRDFNPGEIRGQIHVSPLAGALVMFAPASAGLYAWQRRRARASVRAA
ncbi:MAG: CHRD domain-containing protein [Alphaproteobacteria bacterium]|nr:CHRD domain-containing protein [Alphaproteobacteria bacterium]